jgi:hypothetical protein
MEEARSLSMIPPCQPNVTHLSFAFGQDIDKDTDSIMFPLAEAWNRSAQQAPALAKLLEAFTNVQVPLALHVPSVSCSYMV